MNERTKVAYVFHMPLVDENGTPNAIAQTITKTPPDLCLVKPAVRGGGRHGGPIEGNPGIQNWTPELATLFKNIPTFLYIPTGRWQDEQVPLKTIKWVIDYCMEHLPTAKGFFFDETAIANKPTPVDYFRKIFNYVDPKGRKVCLNHGTRCAEWIMDYSHMNSLDSPNSENFQVFKDIRDGWTRTYPDDRFIGYSLIPGISFDRCVQLSRDYKDLGFGYVLVLPENPLTLWSNYQKYINTLHRSKWWWWY